MATERRRHASKPSEHVIENMELLYIQKQGQKEYDVLRKLASQYERRPTEHMGKLLANAEKYLSALQAHDQRQKTDPNWFPQVSNNHVKSSRERLALMEDNILEKVGHYRKRSKQPVAEVQQPQPPVAAVNQDIQIDQPEPAKNRGLFQRMVDRIRGKNEKVIPADIQISAPSNFKDVSPWLMQPEPSRAPEVNAVVPPLPLLDEYPIPPDQLNDSTEEKVFVDIPGLRDTNQAAPPGYVSLPVSASAGPENKAAAAGYGSVPVSLVDTTREVKGYGSLPVGPTKTAAAGYGSVPVSLVDTTREVKGYGSLPVGPTKPPESKPPESKAVESKSVSPGYVSLAASFSSKSADQSASASQGMTISKPYNFIHVTASKKASAAYANLTAKAAPKVDEHIERLKTLPGLNQAAEVEKVKVVSAEERLEKRGYIEVDFATGLATEVAKTEPNRVKASDYATIPTFEYGSVPKGLLDDEVPEAKVMQADVIDLKRDTTAVVVKDNTATLNMSQAQSKMQEAYQNNQKPKLAEPEQSNEDTLRPS